jgi:hypothetical protein
MLWTIGVELAKYAAFLYFAVLICFSGLLYFQTRDWESVLSILSREDCGQYKRLSSYQVLLLKTLRTARFAAAMGIGILAILSFVQLAQTP